MNGTNKKFECAIVILKSDETVWCEMDFVTVCDWRIKERRDRVGDEDGWSECVWEGAVPFETTRIAHSFLF